MHKCNCGTLLSEMSEADLLPNHSSAKVRLLGAYLRRFLSVISNDGFTTNIDIYDLFCGPGIGSPAVILKEIESLYLSRKERSQTCPRINSHFNDVDRKKVDELEMFVKANHLRHPEIGEISFSRRDYKDSIAELNRNLWPDRLSKVFVFIDPYGYKHIKASDIKELLQKGNIEVLLFQPTQFMYRFDSNGTPEALKDFIGEIVDFEQWHVSDNVWKFIDQLKDGFRNYLGTSIFVDIFTIQKDPQTVFCLFFFSSHIKGFEKMLEAKWDLDTEQGKGWHYSRSNMDGLFPDQRTHPLEQKLKEFLQEKDRTNREIYEFTLQCGFLPKHTVEVFERMQEQNEIVVTRPDGEKVRRKSFYINYKCYKHEPNKVMVRLQ